MISKSLPALTASCAHLDSSVAQRHCQRQSQPAPAPHLFGVTSHLVGSEVTIGALHYITLATLFVFVVVVVALLEGRECCACRLINNLLFILNYYIRRAK